jgi:ubiquinone/menaquinone biosynthesis C-methylase UbiE
MRGSTHDSYRYVASWYDLIIEPLNRKLKSIALKVAPPAEGDRVLDVGCGTGTMLELYRGGQCRLWGLDASPAMLAVARRRLGEAAELSHGDATAMPYDDGFFDWVVLTLMLHEMPPPSRAATLAEVARVVAPEGRVLIVDYADGSARSARGYLIKALTTIIERAAGGEHWKGYRHWLRNGAAAAHGASAGLSVVTERLLGGGNLAVTVLRRRTD